MSKENEVPRGRAEKNIVQPDNPRAWIKDAKGSLVDSVADAAKKDKPFGVRGIGLAEPVQKAGHELLEKTTQYDDEGQYSLYLFAPLAKKGGK